MVVHGDVSKDDKSVKMAVFGRLSMDTVSIADRQKLARELIKSAGLKRARKAKKEAV